MPINQLTDNYSINKEQNDNQVFYSEFSLKII